MAARPVHKQSLRVTRVKEAEKSEVLPANTLTSEAWLASKLNERAATRSPIVPSSKCTNDSSSARQSSCSWSCSKQHAARCTPTRCCSWAGVRKSVGLVRVDDEVLVGRKTSPRGPRTLTCRRPLCCSVARQRRCSPARRKHCVQHVEDQVTTQPHSHTATQQEIEQGTRRKISHLGTKNVVANSCTGRARKSL